MKLKDLLTSPLAVLVTILAFLAGLLGFLPAIAHAVWATAPTWYPALAVTSSVVLPKIGTITVPVVGAVDLASIGQTASVVGAIVFVAYLLDRLGEKFTKKLNEP